MNILNLCLGALGALCIILLLREMKKEYAIYASVAAGILLLTASLGEIIPVYTYIRELSDRTGAMSELSALLKAVCIGMATAFTGEICRDAGETALASKIELCGKAAILALSLPLVKSLVNIAVNGI